MDQELQKSLALIMQKAINGIDAGVVFLQAQLPDVIRQLLMWKAVESTMWFIVNLIISLVCLRYSKKMWGCAKEYKGKNMFDDGQEHRFFAAGLLFIAFAVFGGLCFANISWLQILIAPKIYLIEYAAHLAK